MWTCKIRNSMIIYMHTSKKILKFKFKFLGGKNMKKTLLILAMVVSTLNFAASLDDAALALSRGEVSEEALKNNFSKADFEGIMERYKAMKLERAKKETEKDKVNALLKKRNEELQEAVQKNSRKKVRPSIKDTVNRVYKGLYGDNPERAKRLQELGFTKKEIEEIQKAVNKMVEEDRKTKE